MKRLTVDEIKEAVKGELLSGNGDLVVTGVERDSREMKDGSCFFAFPGEKADGNDFIISSFEKGAYCAVATDREKAEKAAREYSDRAVILTSDAGEALKKLAAYYISKFDIKKIAVTGSNGKTTTKDMIHAICSTKYRTHKTQVNRNNLVGLPLTVLSLEEDTEVAVFEMGMDTLGEIHQMAEIVKPDIAIITNVGTSHMERLGSREGILKAKLEITHFLKPENVLIIPDGLEILTRESAAGDYIMKTVGPTGRSDFVISGTENHGENGMSFYIEHDNIMNRIELPVPGEYNVINASLAIAAASEIGISPEEAAKGLSGFRLAEKRMDIRGAHGIKVIDDTYNASPPAMKAAIDVLMSTGGIRKVAILGDMFELGENSKAFHREVGEYAGKAGVEFLIGIGKDAEFICEGAAEYAGKDCVLHFDTKEGFYEVMSSYIRSGDVVLVKGSRGMAMENVVKKILE